NADQYKLLHFCKQDQMVSPITLKIMTQRNIHLCRAYMADHGDVPVGAIGLTNVDRHFKTASIWAVLGNKRYGGCTREAVSKMLTFGFTELGLHVVNAWTVEINIPAQRVLEALHFKYIGRQRQRHDIDGRPHDRLAFALDATEH